ncbi:MAG: disulfide bond formation protein B [Alphaproteobacteria bacterium]
MTDIFRAADARQIITVILFMNGAVLLGAYGFEIIGGLAPCQLCYYQRVPYVMAIILCAAALLGPAMAQAISAVLMINYMAGAGLGIYHAGVEWHWWAGPATCSAGAGSGGSVEALMAQILAAPVVRCDEIPWSLFGISLAGYNVLISVGLLALSAHVFLRWKKDRDHDI